MTPLGGLDAQKWGDLRAACSGVGVRSILRSMAYAEYKSPLATRYATAAMVETFGDRHRVVLWRRLWIALAEAQAELGLSIDAAQVQAMRTNLKAIDFGRVAELEAQTRHDVMAHIKHFGELVGPDAEKVIHLGATSCFVADNAEQMMVREGLDLLMDRLTTVLVQLREFALEHAALATMAYTHFQPAQLTTVGKRACLWAQDLAYDLETLEQLQARIPMRGAKGTTGTQASYLALFDGDHEKVRELDRKVAASMGFSSTVPVSGQTYPRKFDTWVIHALADLCASAAKFAEDMRLLANKRELDEPFESTQVGSSAMAYKRNPMRSERICALSRFVMAMAANAPQTHAHQWFERTLDDSANRRLVITESFLATDGVLNLLANITAGLMVHPAVIEANMREHLPFMATENVIMAGVRGGESRQELHERIRLHSHAAADAMKAGRSNDLMERMRGDDKLGPYVDDSVLDPGRYTGRSATQVKEFVTEMIDPILARHEHRRGRFVPRVRV